MQSVLDDREDERLGEPDDEHHDGRGRDDPQQPRRGGDVAGARRHLGAQVVL